DRTGPRGSGGSMTISELLMPKLPAGFSTRPVDPDADSPAVTALCEAIAIGEYGVSDVNLQAVRESYNAPGFDPQTDARVVFDAAGWHRERTTWEMEIELETTPSVPPVPAPLLIRAARPGSDEHAIYEAEVEAFADHYGYLPRPHDSWLQLNTRIFPYDPSLWFVADDEGQIAGIS